MSNNSETSVAFASKSEALSAADKEKYRRIMDDLFALVATRNRSPELGHYHVEYNYEFIRLYLKPEATGALKP